MFAWVLRGLVVNEFDSGKYDTEVTVSNSEGGVSTITQGETIIVQFGFVDRDDQPYTSEWAGWAILFTLGVGILATFISTYFLSSIRFVTGGSLVIDQGDDELEEIDEADLVEIPFKRVDLTFKDIHYIVKASTSDEKLELLKEIDGIIEAGRMTALMGSSGAGKTTLMDVLALRKNSGEITGEIRLNGHLQEKNSFRRCAGYVEQFDVQTPQLTIRETCEFSAKLRLEETDPTVTPESITKFVDQTLNMLELTNLQDLQVGSDATGGLSFEQKKRLSIAVEVVANPSIIFLDEPTSGLVSFQCDFPTKSRLFGLALSRSRDSLSPFLLLFCRMLVPPLL
jgi:ABC-type lipoprotein export system ATPase subunit